MTPKELRRTQTTLTQTDLADVIGATQATISNYEQGATVPDVCRVARMARAMQVTPSQLFAAYVDLHAAAIYT